MSDIICVTCEITSYLVFDCTQDFYKQCPHFKLKYQNQAVRNEIQTAYDLNNMTDEQIKQLLFRIRKILK